MREGTEKEVGEMNACSGKCQMSTNGLNQFNLLWAAMDYFLFDLKRRQKVACSRAYTTVCVAHNRKGKNGMREEERTMYDYKSHVDKARHNKITHGNNRKDKIRKRDEDVGLLSGLHHGRLSHPKDKPKKKRKDIRHKS